MSDEDQSIAIGKAIQAEDASRKKLAAIDAELQDAEDRLRELCRLFGPQIGDSRPRGQALIEAIDKLPNLDKLKELIRDRDEESRRYQVLSGRSRILRGV